METVVKDPLPHHEQQELCTSRLPYRQGRKLTAVKVYTINNESNHLLIFGVPSINLRQETKALFMKFGKLKQFSINKEYKCEQFTETYHAVFENIKSARIAKKMLDTKNFYGSSLHVCYAPELETIEETSYKLFQRQKDVLSRLRNLQKEDVLAKKQLNEKIIEKSNVTQNLESTNKVSLNMGNENIIYLNNNKKRKLKNDNASSSKKKSKDHNHYEITNNHKDNNSANSEPTKVHNEDRNNHNDNNKTKDNHNDNVEIIDFTSTEKETITNINEALNYNKFGNEIIKKVQNKPLNVIKFNFNKKT